MIFKFQSMKKEDALIIAGWHYEPPYSFYDADSDPEDREELLNCEQLGDSYYATFGESDELVGFFCYVQEDRTVEIGLGLRPDLTGQGLGLDFVLAGMAFGANKFNPHTFRLAVATFNKRGIRVYEKAGFQTKRIFRQKTNGGEYEFVEMSRPASL